PSLMMLDGGSIGVEFAQIFRRFGCEVMVVEMAVDIIQKEDPEVIARVRQILRDEGIEIHTGWSAKSVRREGNQKIIRIENKNGESREVRVEQIFVASGRRGNTENLGLEAAGVKIDKSYVVANKYLATTA